jgi:hypothetical protein
MRNVNKVISGAQTGVDQGALLFASRNGLLYGGFVPKGFKMEDGAIIDEEITTILREMIELKSSRYAVRTRKNVEAATATLLVSVNGKMGRGTELTKMICEEISKPYFVVDFMNRAGEFSFPDVALDIDNWVVDNDVTTLNVAGSRESKNAGIQKATYDFLVQLWERNPPNPR